MTKLQIAVLAIGGVLVVGGIVYYSARQLQNVGPSGIPDPGAEIRKKYAQQKTGGDPIVKADEAVANPATTTSTAIRPSQPQRPQTVTPTPVPQIPSTPQQQASSENRQLMGRTGTGGTISDEPLTSSPTPEPQTQPTRPRPIRPNTAIGLLPEGSGLELPPPTPVPLEPIIRPPSIVSPSSPTPTPAPASSQASRALPLIPQELLDQTPPDLDIAREEESSAPAQIVIASRRYLFNNQSETALGGRPVVKQNNDREVTGRDLFNIPKFAPMGEDIEIALMQNVAGNSFEVPVTAAVWNPFYFRGNKLLETGDKVMGKAAAGRTRDRLVITFDKIIFKSGKSLSLNALALDMDGTVGVKGYVVGDRLLQILMPTLLEAGSEFLKVFQKQTEVTQQTILGTTTTKTINNDLQTTGSKALEKITDRINSVLMEEIEEQRPYVLVPAGTVAKARLMAPLDISKADYGK